ncbi:hypothetical protein J2Y03_005650 [Neobacillus niacini]|nr:hypothetical protein [Neobacillus niacini]
MYKEDRLPQNAKEGILSLEPFQNFFHSWLEILV